MRNLVKTENRVRTDRGSKRQTAEMEKQQDKQRNVAKLDMVAGDSVSKRLKVKYGKKEKKKRKKAAKTKSKR